MKIRLRLVTKKWSAKFKLQLPASWLILIVVSNINLIVQIIAPLFN